MGTIGAKLAWYTIDPLFFRNDSRTPNHISNSPSQANNYSREVLETEVFPNKDPEPGLINNLPTLDLAFYPTERGPYNYDTLGGSIFFRIEYGRIIKRSGNKVGWDYARDSIQ